MKKNILWLDDCRFPPEGAYWAKTVTQAIQYAKENKIDEAHLDHDLGDYGPLPEELCLHEDQLSGTAELTGYVFLLWCYVTNNWPTKISLHTANPIARVQMRDFIKKHKPSL